MEKDAFKEYVNELLTINVKTDTTGINNNILTAGIVGVLLLTLFLIAK